MSKLKTAGKFGGEIRLSPQGAEIIGNAEGCKRDPYKCPANVLTVGIGSTAAGGEPINPNKHYSDLEIIRKVSCVSGLISVARLLTSRLLPIWEL